MTGPSSPGLRTRTEIAVLHAEHALGSRAAAGAAPQFQSQFQVHCDVDDEGVTELVPVELSEQFQVQFQTQLTGSEGATVTAGSSVSVCVEADKSGTELVLPVLLP